ncbi:MAG: hypothetical protein N2Z67_08110 [Acetobacteraceae bacterium]|nr:hypothetical protein [Acetobacteraceae bacterium]
MAALRRLPLPRLARDLAEACVSALERGRRPEQRGSVPVPRAPHDLLGRPALDDLARIHHGDAVADLGRDREVVRDEQR